MVMTGSIIDFAGATLVLIGAVLMIVVRRWFAARIVDGIKQARPDWEEGSARRINEFVTVLIAAAIIVATVIAILR